MNTAEKMMAESVSAATVSRDDVRAWVMQEQTRCRHRANRNGLAAVLAFAMLGSGLWFSVSQQWQEIHRLVDRHPPKALSELQEITQEVCNAPPADYFVQQLSHSKSVKHLSLSSIAGR